MSLPALFDLPLEMDSSQNTSSRHSLSSSPPDYPPQQRSLVGFVFGSLGRRLYTQRNRRLTRQRKLRHLNASELGALDSSERSYSLPVSPKSTGSPSPKCSERWSWSSVPQHPQPQPLPLPELPSQMGRRVGPPDLDCGRRGVRSSATVDGNGTGDRTSCDSTFCG